MINCKLFSQLMVTVIKENLNLQLTLLFCSSITFVIEIVFISEQVTEYRFRALLQISDKFITILNVFSCMILQFRFTSLDNFVTILHESEERSGQVILLNRPQFLPQKFICLRKTDETFQNGKRYEDKAQCLLTP